jgi:hypothetical protein
MQRLIEDMATVIDQHVSHTGIDVP